MGILSYLKPAQGKKEGKKEEPAAELAEKRPVVPFSPRTSFPFGSPGFGTPASQTPGNATPWGSRPASLYPAGENGNSTDFNDLKCDVMVNWLYQQQMEKLWTAGGHDEGVMLKKNRGAYTCCPADIVEEQFGFFQAVQMLNVRVCYLPIVVWVNQ